MMTILRSCEDLNKFRTSPRGLKVTGHNSFSGDTISIGLIDCEKLPLDIEDSELLLSAPTVMKTEVDLGGHARQVPLD